MVAQANPSVRRSSNLMAHTRQQSRLIPRRRSFTSGDGIEFVRCRICGDCLRVISGRLLSKHDTDRETFMEEYGLSPDELVAKDSRRLHSSRRDYHPYSKRDWIAAIKKVYKRDESIDHQLKLRGLLHRQISGLSALYRSDNRANQLCVSQLPAQPP